MRTTLDLQPDLLSAAKQIAAHRATSLGAVISELALKGLQAEKEHHVRRVKTQSVNRNGFPLLGDPSRARPIALSDVQAALED